MYFHILIKIGLLHITQGDIFSLHTWHEATHYEMHRSIIICIKMIFQWNPYSRLIACSPFLGNHKKTIFCFRLICTNGCKKRVVDAFIKHGNLPNGLWQSHWRSLFRCRWLPPFWLSLSLVELPVREKRRKLPPVTTDCQSITTAVCLYVRLTDCQYTLPLNPLWLKLFPLHSV